MQKHFPSIRTPYEARSASDDARRNAKGIAFSIGLVVANTANIGWVANTWFHILSSHPTVGLFLGSSAAGTFLLAYHGWLLVSLRRSFHARKIVKSVDGGTACDPKIADALTIVGISLVTAVERYDAMVKRWRAYEDGVGLELIDRLPDEDTIRDAMVTAGEELEAYAKGIDLLFRRRALIKELSASAVTNPLPTFSSTLDNLRLADERLKNAFALRENLPAVDPERLLAEPLNLAKLNALDKDMARIPVPAQLTNG
ncbi:MAG: hypothetical protein WCO25_00730 [Candidatus Uhrbacteria bacterium]